VILSPERGIVGSIIVCYDNKRSIRVPHRIFNMDQRLFWITKNWETNCIVGRQNGGRCSSTGRLLMHDAWSFVKLTWYYGRRGVNGTTGIRG
jgi:hypothetical protein